MPITVTCPKCRESLEIPNELIGGDVRCGSCLEIFTAEPAVGFREVPPPLPDVEDEPRPRKRGGRRKNVSRPDAAYGPIEFDPDRKRKQGMGPAAGILLLIFGLLGCGCCGVFGYFVVQTMDPDYKEFQSPDGRFVALFPAEVRQSTRPTGRAPGEMVPSHEATRRFIQETFFIYHVELTNAEKREPQKVIDRLCKGLVSANSGTELSRTDRLHDGNNAADILIRLPGRKRFIQARVIVGDGRGYVVGVSVQNDPNGMIWLDEFFDGFQIVEAQPNEKKDDPKKDN